MCHLLGTPEQRFKAPWTSLCWKALLVVTALPVSLSQTPDKIADTILVLILVKFLHHVSFLFWLVGDICTANNASQDPSAENFLLTELASDSCVSAKTSYLVPGSHANREELSCFFPPLTNSPNLPRWSEEIPERGSQCHTVWLCGKTIHVTKKWKKGCTAKCH